LATMRWPACCANSATACNPIARPGKAATTRPRRAIRLYQRTDE
jgi:hypothetical protein